MSTPLIDDCLFVSEVLLEYECRSCGCAFGVFHEVRPERALDMADRPEPCIGCGETLRPRSVTVDSLPV